MGVGGSRSSFGYQPQYLFVQDPVAGSEEAVRAVAPGISGEIRYAATGLGDEEGGGGVVPDGVAGADGDVEVARREPGSPHARASQGTQLPAGAEDLQDTVFAGVATCAQVGHV